MRWAQMVRWIPRERSPNAYSELGSECGYSDIPKRALGRAGQPDCWLDLLGFTRHKFPQSGTRLVLQSRLPKRSRNDLAASDLDGP